MNNKKRIHARTVRILGFVAERIWPVTLLSLVGLSLAGCASPRQPTSLACGPSKSSVVSSRAERIPPEVTRVAHTAVEESRVEVVHPEQLPSQIMHRQTSLDELTLAAEVSNPFLRRLFQDYQAARAKAQYIGKLPDPTIGTNVFGHPIETAAGAQRANLTAAQMLPWLPRLNAQAQQAYFEAAAIGQQLASERLKVFARVRILWYQLYVIEKHIEINTANQRLLQSLIDVANARVATGNTSQGDVLIGTLEFSRLEESLVELRQQRSSTTSEINRQVGRSAEIQIASPEQLHVVLPAWHHSMLRDAAWANQPEIESARIRTQASRWGIEVARLRRRPDVSLNANWFAIDDNRPLVPLVDVGQDAWSVGATLSVPIYHKKNNAIEREARWQHAASHSTVEEIMQRYDSAILDLWEQARAADKTARLYQDTIIPEAERALNADQQSYANGEVEFDRVIGDFRNLLTLELAHYRSIGQLATAIARIKQATGTELAEQPVPPNETSQQSATAEFPESRPSHPHRPPEPAEID
ncbi:MAG: TolC family protein [Pirellulaceae bacterium]|nr:TolC family protein [Pirellulaceae bacterium]